MVLAQPLPLDVARARRIAGTWLDLSLVRQALEEGEDLADSGRVGRAATRPLMDLRIARLLAERVPERTLASDEVAAVYEAGAWRFAQHILKSSPPGTAPERDEAQRAAAERVRAELEGGLPWSEAVAQSDDPATADQDGSLGLLSGGEMPQAFDQALAAMGPGEISPVIRTPLGYHIVRRPALRSVREAYTTLASERQVDRERQVWAGEQAVEAALRLRPDAGRIVRRIAADPWRETGADTLATFTGGAMTASALAATLQLLPPEAHDEMVRAPVEELNAFVQTQAVRALLAHRAVSEIGSLDPTAESAVREDARRRLEALTESVRGAASTGALLEAMVARRTEWLDVPASLQRELRERYSWSVGQDGLVAAVERAQRLLGATDEAPTPMLEPGS